MIAGLAVTMIAGITMYYLYARPVASTNGQPQEPSAPQTKADRAPTAGTQTKAALDKRAQESNAKMIQTVQRGVELATKYDDNTRSVTAAALKLRLESRYRALFEAWQLSATEARRIVDAAVQREMANLEQMIAMVHIDAEVTDWSNVEQLRSNAEKKRRAKEATQTVADNELLVILGAERFQELQEADRKAKTDRTKK